MRNTGSRRGLTALDIESIQPTGRRFTVRDGKCPGLVLRVGASGRKTWAYDYRDPAGRRQTFTIGPANHITPAEARKRVKSLGADPAGDRRRDRQARKLSAARTIRNYLIGDYRTHHLSRRRSGDATLARILSAWAPFLDQDMAMIDPVALARHRTARLRKGLKPQTLNRDRTALLALFSAAVDDGLINSNPLRHPAFKPLKVEEDRRVRWLGQRDELEDIRDERGRKIGERERFMAALKKAPEYLRDLVVVAMNTGLRRGELFSLQWEDVSLARREIIVRASNAKAGKTRHVPLNAQALEVFRRKSKIRHISGLVFVNPKTGTRFTTLKKAWSTLAARACLQDFRFHDLRHDYASRLVQAGVDLYVVRDLLGHANIATTERYAHLAPDQRRAAVEALT